jgi:hypothetical protein
MSNDPGGGAGRGADDSVSTARFSARRGAASGVCDGCRSIAFGVGAGDDSTPFATRWLGLDFGLARAPLVERLGPNCFITRRYSCAETQRPCVGR